MILHDRNKTTMNIGHIVTIRRQDAQMAGHGGLVCRFVGGVETLEYDDEECLNWDYAYIQGCMAFWESAARDSLKTLVSEMPKDK